MAKRKTAMASEPNRKPPTGGGYKAKPNVPLQRLSPGVYRGAGGGLVTQRGRPLPGQGRGIAAALQSNKGPAPSPDMRATIEAAAGRGFNQGQNTAMDQGLAAAQQQWLGQQAGRPMPVAQPSDYQPVTPPPQPAPGDRVNYAPGGMTGTQMPGNPPGYGNYMYQGPINRIPQDYAGGIAQQQMQPYFGSLLGNYPPQMMQPQMYPKDAMADRQRQIMPYQNYSSNQMDQRYADVLQQRYRGG